MSAADVRADRDRRAPGRVRVAACRDHRYRPPGVQDGGLELCRVHDRILWPIRGSCWDCRLRPARESDVQEYWGYAAEPLSGRAVSLTVSTET